MSKPYYRCIQGQNEQWNFIPSNIGVFDFIYPSAANPTMKPRAGKNSQAGRNTGIPTTKSTAENKRKHVQMDTNVQNSQNQSPSTAENSPVQSKEKRSGHEQCECISKYEDLNKSLQAILQSRKKFDKLDEIQATVANIKADLETNNSKVQKLEDDVEMLHNELEKVQQTVEDFKSDKVRIEVEMRKTYLILTGIQDEQNETEHESFTKVESQVRKFQPQFQFQYDILYRLGRFTNGRTRKIRVKFVTLKDRNNFLELKKDTTSPFFIDEDEPNEIRAAKFQVRKKLEN